MEITKEIAKEMPARDNFAKRTLKQIFSPQRLHSEFSKRMMGKAELELALDSFVQVSKKRAQGRSILENEYGSAFFLLNSNGNYWRDDVISVMKNIVKEAEQTPVQVPGGNEFLSRAYYLLGKAQLRRNCDYGGAIISFEKALSLGRDSLSTRRQLGDAHRKFALAFIAEEARKEGCTLGNDQLYEIVAFARSKPKIVNEVIDNLSNAMAYYNTVVARSPKQAKALYGEGMLLLLRGDIDDAIAKLEASIGRWAEAKASHLESSAMERWEQFNGKAEQALVMAKSIKFNVETGAGRG